ncbi:glycosyltransferase family 2 protein [Robertmurraya sp. Marseille-Q9965]
MKKTLQICAVMVCYHPNIPELKIHIKSIIPQVEKLYIVDNTETLTNQTFFEELKVDNKIEWFALQENKGIGFAQNVGIKRAIESGFDAILLLDQDSHPPDNLVQKLTEGAKYLFENGEKIACLGPEIYNKYSSETYEPLLNKGENVFSDFVEKDAIISSGTLIFSEAVKQIGDMNEELFIDLVDFEWCWRARKNNLKCFMYKQIKMGHMVGQKNVKLFGVYNLLIPSPVRHYYQFRNTFILIKIGYVPLYWKMRTIIERIIDLIVYPIFIKPRGKRISYILKGILDGITGRKGIISK